MTYEITLDADHESARAIGPWLEQSLRELSEPHHARRGELELAVHELAINIVDHAYADLDDGAYCITLTLADGNIHATFVDQGRPFENDAPIDHDEPHVGGYGLMIVEQLAVETTYERIGTRNRWTLVFGPNSPQPQESP